VCPEMHSELADQARARLGIVVPATLMPASKPARANAVRNREECEDAGEGFPRVLVANARAKAIA
jgi:hypothetical protein